jgi:hypothetical protein
VERIPIEETVKKVFRSTPEGKSFCWKKKKKEIDDIENDVQKMGVRGWGKK